MYYKESYLGYSKGGIIVYILYWLLGREWSQYLFEREIEFWLINAQMYLERRMFSKDSYVHIHVCSITTFSYYFIKYICRILYVHAATDPTGSEDNHRPMMVFLWVNTKIQQRFVTITTSRTGLLLSITRSGYHSRLILSSLLFWRLPWFPAVKTTLL